MASPADLLLGIDLGTTTARCAIFDLDGQEVASAATENTVDFPRPRWAEVDPERWWRVVAEVTREALGRVEGGAERVAAVGVTGLMHAPVLVDSGGNPVAPAHLWMDQRSAAQCARLQSESVAAGINVGFDFSTTHTAPKLRWFADESPAVLRQASEWLLPKDFIRLRLTGEGGTDLSDAGGTALFDRDTGEWRWDLIDLTRTSRTLVPRVRPAAALAGVVTARAAAQTGLREGTPVATGGADTFCTRLGAGPVEPGEVCLYMGTASWLTLFGERGAGGRPVFSGFGSTATTGAALRWARDLLTTAESGFASEDRGVFAKASTSVGESYEALTRRAAGVAPGAEGLICLPHLMGERGPVPDPAASGALVGLTLRHTPAHVARAVLEGTVFQIRRVLEAHAQRPRSGIVCGGATRSALWMQILADVTGITLRVPAVTECAALGAAILGGVAAGLLEMETAQTRMTRNGVTFTPANEAGARYEALYRRYRELDDLLGPWFKAQMAYEPAVVSV